MIADALEESRSAKRDVERGGASGASVRAQLAQLSTKQLLALGHQHHLVATILRERRGDSDIRLMITAAAHQSLPMRGPAIDALAYQQRLEAFQFAAELCDETTPGRLRRYMSHALRLLPYEQTRPLVRQWFESDQKSRRWAAADALGDHAIPPDIPMIRECLCRDLLDPDTSNPSIVSSLLHALCRNPDQGPYGELISIFNSVPWSYVRSDVARTMAATDPAFAEETAPGCLWDSEPELRTFAAMRVATGALGVRPRLERLAADWAEVADVQLAARSRLQAD